MITELVVQDKRTPEEKKAAANKDRDEAVRDHNDMKKEKEDSLKEDTVLGRIKKFLNEYNNGKLEPDEKPEKDITKDRSRRDPDDARDDKQDRENNRKE